MKVCRFRLADPTPRLGLLNEAGTAVLDLSGAGLHSLAALLDEVSPVETLRRASAGRLPEHALSAITFLAPVEHHEVWAAGVTYLRSKAARMEESDFSATAYDRVYAAARPEIFFKSIAEKVVPTGGEVGIRRDATWNVPEPELALVLNSRGEVAGFTVGNDMSSRDIEGENLLYLPQAKIYEGSCALGPWVTVGATEAAAREWTITLAIDRNGARVFGGETVVSQIKRTFQELAGYLFRSQRFPHGAVLLTGTGIVPTETFTLQPGDTIAITISGIGTLKNTVSVV